MHRTNILSQGDFSVPVLEVSSRRTYILRRENRERKQGGEKVWWSSSMCIQDPKLDLRSRRPQSQIRNPGQSFFKAQKVSY